MPKPTVEDVYRDLDISSKAQSKLHRQMKEDMEFALGKQWDDEKFEKLRQAKVTPLTINQIKPLVKIISGIERQSRSDFVAFPEGKEDQLISEIITRLLKNVVKRSGFVNKASEQFKEGVITGLCYIEPYLDYTYDLINGEMKFRKINADRVFWSLDGEEYDLSDRRYIIKCSYNMSKEQLSEMFPDGESKIEKAGFSKIDFKDIGAQADKIQTQDYTFRSKDEVSGVSGDGGYDLVEYFYKYPKSVYFVADRQTGEIQEFQTKKEADAVIEQGAQTGLSDRLVMIHKKIPEIRLKQVIGDVEMSDEVAWSYPRYKFFPLFPFFAERCTADISEPELLIQGIVRSLKDLQVELNSSRTLELMHVNSTVNSGYIVPKGAFDDKNKDLIKRLGSSPGIYAEYDTDKTGGVVNPDTFRARPAEIPAAHMTLSNERLNELKEASGVNPNLLANDDSQQSGRAILLKQRQGLVMIQEALDNYGETKRLVGKFVLSQLGEIFTVETALQVIGDAFMKENFERPQIDEQGNIVMDERGQPVLAVDPKEAQLVINKILNDSALGKYDVSIGEGAYSETIKITNFNMIMDMVSKGIPIPPDMIVEESTLGEAQKKRIIGAISAAAQQAQAVAQQPRQGAEVLA